MNRQRPDGGSHPVTGSRQAPAVQALAIQGASFGVALFLAHAIALLTEWQLSIAAAALLQGLIAAALSRWRRLAPWWLAIQLLFPLASIGLLSLRLPPSIFLVAFVFLLGLYWSTFRTQVPFYPSNRAVWDAVADALPRRQSFSFVDIGSGLGGLTMHLAERLPEGVFTGVEIAPLPWLASVLRARIAGSRARFVRGDYGNLDFARHDVVFAYLSPAAMPALWRKARAEMRPGSLLLSYEFPIPGIEPNLICTPADDGPPLYGWRF